MKGKISEIFEGIQGEGIYVGVRQLFVRSYGCNLQCKFCDTRLSHYEKYSTLQLYNMLKRFNRSYHSICFTGGEPLLQKDFLKEVLNLIRIDGITIYLETNGTLFEALSEVINHVDIIAVDLKLPSSTGLSSFWDEHKRFLEVAKQKELFVKTVISSTSLQEDLEEAIDLTLRLDANIPFILQPNHFELGKELLAKIFNLQKVCKKSLSDVRVIPQVHKLLNIK